MSRARDMRRRNNRLASFLDKYGWKRVRTEAGWTALLPTGGGYCPVHGVTDFYGAYDDDAHREWDLLHEGCAESVEAERSALSDAEDEAWLESKPEPAL